MQDISVVYGDIISLLNILVLKNGTAIIQHRSLKVMFIFKLPLNRPIFSSSFQLAKLLSVLLYHPAISFGRLYCWNTVQSGSYNRVKECILYLGQIMVCSGHLVPWSVFNQVYPFLKRSYCNRQYVEQL